MCSRFKPDVPLGSGPHKAIMATEVALPEHVIYYPADLAQLGAKKMPVVIWGNGSAFTPAIVIGNSSRKSRRTATW